MKTMHAFHDCTSAQEFVERISSVGATVDVFLKTAVAAGAGATVLAVGSIPKGFGRPESDIDLLLIAEKRSDLLTDGPTISFVSGSEGQVTAHKLFFEGVEFDVEALSLESLDGLGRLVDRLVGVLREPGSMKGLPILPDEDIRLLDMLRHGWVLHGHEFASQLRGRLKVDLLPLYWATANFIQHMEYVEDVFALRDADPETFCTILRLCAQRAANSVLGMAGVTDLNDRWTWKHLHRALGEDGADAALLKSTLARLMFMTPEAAAGDRGAALRALVLLGQGIEARLRSDARVAPVVAALRQKFNYVYDEATYAASTAPAQ